MTKRQRQLRDAKQHAAQLALQMVLIRGENGNRLIGVLPKGPFRVVASRPNHFLDPAFGRDVWFNASEGWKEMGDAVDQMRRLREYESLADWTLTVYSDDGREIATLGEVR